MLAPRLLCQVDTPLCAIDSIESSRPRTRVGGFHTRPCSASSVARNQSLTFSACQNTLVRSHRKNHNKMAPNSTLQACTMQQQTQL
mgnify:CR=1 FL=1